MKGKVLFGLTIWILSTLALGYFDIFANLPRQIFGGSVFIAVTTTIALYLKQRKVQEFVNSFSLKQIAFIHIFRIFAGFLFLYYSDKLPATFVSKAAYGDIIAGVLAILAIFANNKIINYAFHIFGLIDLVTALSIGLYFNIIGDTQMATIFHLPLVLIPLFFVPILLVSHITSLKKINSKTTL